MKIEFLTQDDPLYILPFFEEFFANYGSEFKVLRVSSCRVMGKRPRFKLLWELAHLYGVLGFPRILSRVVRARLFGMLPRSRGASRFLTLAQLCRAYNVPFEQVGSPNAAEFIAEMRQRAPDVLVSVACPYILKEPLLKLPRFGCINIHHAPLPHYKGMMPTFWQMYHGEKAVGVTVHYMAPKVDEGAALLQEELEIRDDESLDQLIRRAKRHGAHCMAKVLRQVAEGKQRPVSLDNSKGSYFTFPTLDEIREFHRRGFRVV
ncbi:MAG TPA: formyltransferase family protein [Candidatus Acidoferrales bacterium]|jgi:methionyl-tRNA formyltransferase|nr:formyltransferase family protein [Candidatus Acidoferrales bacterium]